MAGSQQISYLWKDTRAARTYTTGVSIHGHTNQSRETLNFVANWGRQFPFLRPWLEKAENAAHDHHGVKIQYSRAYWTPPLTPALAYDLESSQIHNKLGLNSLVSLTDHDSIQAPLLLRTLPTSRDMPVSLEWTVPYGGDQSFHLGIHNLPADQAATWMKPLTEFTARPSETRLTELLDALHALPNVLIVFNHPLWDLYLIGRDKTAQRVQQFLTQNHPFLHALELNGLRNWDENRRVRHLAAKWNKLLIAGGDRHGCEPNALVNLSNAATFSEFVCEIREGQSHVIFMPQYAEPWKHRVLCSTLDAIRDYPDFPEGSRLWDERVFHPDARGEIHSLHALWPDGNAPWYMRHGLRCVLAMGKGTLSKTLRLAWSDPQDLQYGLGDEPAWALRP